MSSKKKTQPKDIPEVVKKSKAKMTRPERKEEELKEELHIEEPKEFVLNDADKENIRHQCERMHDAKMLGAINSFMAKYAVYYRGTWLFVVYNRDKNRLVDFIHISNLTNMEKNTFQVYKNKIEMARRKAAAPAPQVVRPVVMVKQVRPPVDFSDDDDE